MHASARVTPITARKPLNQRKNIPTPRESGNKDAWAPGILRTLGSYDKVYAPSMKSWLSPAMKFSQQPAFPVTRLAAVIRRAVERCIRSSYMLFTGMILIDRRFIC